MNLMMLDLMDRGEDAFGHCCTHVENFAKKFPMLDVSYHCEAKYGICYVRIHLDVKISINILL